MSTPMHDMPEHFPIEVNDVGEGPTPGGGNWACWCGDSTCERWRAARHEPALDGPLSYPGGKDGMYQVRCLAGDYVSTPGDSPSSRRMWEGGIMHQASMLGEVLGRAELIMRIAEARNRARYRDVADDPPTG